MDEKVSDWSAAVLAVRTRLARPNAKFNRDQTEELINFMTSKKVVKRDEVELKAKQIVGAEEAWNFINTTIGNVTMAIHPAGTVPDPGGWYLWDGRLEVYVVDRGFALAWKVGWTS
jgi:hypothetical protein